jgi:glycosyltransferase involved in cell wall biosynthesis
MKLAIVFDSEPNSGGGFYQSLKTMDTLCKNVKENFQFQIISTNLLLQKDIEKKGYKSIIFNKKWAHFYSRINSSKFLNFFLKKFKIKNPFSKFLRKNNIDLVYFLGLSSLINLCDEHNFVVNIYDLNHRLDNLFPEYKKNVIDDREELFLNCINKSFKIILDTDRTKDEMEFIYRCPKDKIEVVPFNTFLPDLYENNKDSILNKINLNKFNFLEGAENFFYPAQFWAHKNHIYIIEAANFLKKKNVNFNIIFCGSNKGNLNFIKEEIRIYGLDKNIKIFNFLLDEEVIYLYLKASAIIIPTYVARSTLPLYESFYFKKTIFYSKEVLDKKLEDLIIPVDLKNPKDLAEKLEYFIHNKNNETNSKRIINARNYFNLYCNEKNISDKIYKIFEEYKYLRKRWVKN